MLPPSQRLEHESQRPTSWRGAERSEPGRVLASQKLAAPIQAAITAVAIAILMGTDCSGRRPGGERLSGGAIDSPLRTLYRVTFG